jgi:hypothetical protein
MAALTGKALVQRQHADYVAWAPIWRKLADAHEGTGGFADGTYLVPHPREWVDHTAPKPRIPTKKLLERRALARYEHWPKRILKTFADSLFRQMPTRQVGPATGGDATPIETWWDDVDGHGTHIDDFWPKAWKVAGVFGHVFVLFDRAPGAPVTAADARRPFVRLYTPLDVPDWVDERGKLTAIKCWELPPRASLDEAVKPGVVWTRIVTDVEWALYDEKGVRQEGAEHGLGRLPVVVLYAERRVLTDVVGASLLGDPQLFVDYYNLVSEHRELLRKQTFSLLNIPLGPEGGVQAAKDLLGDSTGTDNVLFSALPASLISPDKANTEAYQAERSALLRAIFRLAGLTWESDTRNAEAEGSLKLKREDMNIALSGYADRIEQADYALAELFYASQLSPERGAAQFEADEIQIRYPETFDPTPFKELLEEAQASLTLGMGLAFKKALRKRLVEKFLPDLPDDELRAILAEIEGQSDEDNGGALSQALLGRLKQAGVVASPGGAAGGPQPSGGVPHAEAQEPVQ